MIGWKIFVQSLRLVFANIGMAFRISGVLYLIGAAAQVLYVETDSSLTASDGTTTLSDPTGSDLLMLLLAVVVQALVYLWIAVAWHRFVLLRETPSGLIPAFDGDRMVAYLGLGLLISLIVGLVAAVLLMLGIGLAAGSGSAALLGLVMAVVIAVAAMIFYRLSAVLPASATHNGIGIRQAWEKTTGASGTFILLAIITSLASILLQLPMLAGAAPGSLLSLIYNLVVQWFILMVGLSIMTTIYGHYVEGRSID